MEANRQVQLGGTCDFVQHVETCWEMLREGTLQSEAWPGAELGRAAFLLVAEPGGFHSQRQSISFANTAFADEGEKMREMSKLQKPFLKMSEDCEAKHGSPVLSYAVLAGLWGFSEFLLETNSVWQFDTICDMWHDWHVNASQTELILEARSPQSLQTRQAFQGFKRYRQDRLAKASANHIARTLVAPVRLCGLRTQMSDWTQMCYWDSWDFYFGRATVLNWPQLRNRHGHHVSGATDKRSWPHTAWFPCAVMCS